MAKRLTKRTIRKIHELHAENISGAEISRLVKRSLGTVYRVLKDGPPKNGQSAKASANSSDISKVLESIVEQRVEAKFKVVREAVLQALTV